MITVHEMLKDLPPTGNPELDALASLIYDHGELYDEMHHYGCHCAALGDDDAAAADAADHYRGNEWAVHVAEVLMAAGCRVGQGERIAQAIEKQIPGAFDKSIVAYKIAATIARQDGTS